MMKKTIIYILCIIFFGNLMNADNSKLLDRNEIDLKYKWDLTQIYSSDEEWEKDYKQIYNLTNKLTSFKGTLHQSAEQLYEALIFSDKLWAKYLKLSQYASLSKDLDLGIPKYQEMYEKANNLGNLYAQNISFFRPEILSIPEEKLNNFIEQNENLKIYKHKLENLLRMKPHTLSPSEEQILSLMEPVDNSFMTTYRLWTNVDVDYPIIKDENGNDFQLSPARYYQGMYNINREFRKNVYKNFYKPFMQFRNFLSSLYYGSIKSNIFQAKARKYNSTLEWSLDNDALPIEVYLNLINTVNQNLKPLHRWCNLKKSILKLDKLHPYDTYVTLFPSNNKKYTYDEAVEIVLKALKPLGEEYIKNLNYAFDNRWVDVYETKGKRSGAYSSGASKESHPYVLLNWSGTIDDIFTLAHEMGHNMHSLFTAQTQPYAYADYPIFLAEVASITNEMLLLDYLIKNAQSKEEKLTLIEKYINNIKSTFYRQTRFAEFEYTVQKYVENGGVITADYLSKTFGDMYQKYWGNDMFVDEEEKNSWSRIHHFFYDYYVYSYATSFAAAQLIASNIKSQGPKSIQKHLEFLKAGNSDYPINILKKNGVDMSTPEPILAVIKKMNELLDELEELIGNK